MTKKILFVGFVFILFIILGMYLSSEDKYTPKEYIFYNGNYYLVLNYSVNPKIIDKIICYTTTKTIFNIQNGSSNVLNEGTPLFSIIGEDKIHPKAIAYIRNNKYRLAILTGLSLDISKYLNE